MPRDAVLGRAVADLLNQAGHHRFGEARFTYDNFNAYEDTPPEGLLHIAPYTFTRARESRANFSRSYVLLITAITRLHPKAEDAEIDAALDSFDAILDTIENQGGATQIETDEGQRYDLRQFQTHARLLMQAQILYEVR